MFKLGFSAGLSLGGAAGQVQWWKWGSCSLAWLFSQEPGLFLGWVWAGKGQMVVLGLSPQLWGGCCSSSPSSGVVGRVGIVTPGDTRDKSITSLPKLTLPVTEVTLPVLLESLELVPVVSWDVNRRSLGCFPAADSDAGGLRALGACQRREEMQPLSECHCRELKRSKFNLEAVKGVYEERQK